MAIPQAMERRLESDMGLQSRTHNLLRSTPFHIGLLCGVASALVDCDHILAYYLKTDGRFLHLPLLAGAVSVILYCGTRATGLVIRNILRRR